MRRMVLLTGMWALTAAAPALAAVTGTFTGKTSANGRVVIRVRRGQINKRPPSTISYRAACNSGDTLHGGTVLSGSLHRGNTFSVVNSRYTGTLAGGYVGKYTTTVRFSIHGGVANGMLNVRAAILRHGRVIDHCATGTVTFRATRTAGP